MNVSKKKVITIVVVIVLLAVAVGLYSVIYVAPTIAGYAKQTYLIEHKELPLMDEEDVLFVRNETLFLAWSDGEGQRVAEEGEKVRQGAPVFTIGKSNSAATEDDANEDKDEDKDKAEEEDTSDEYEPTDISEVDVLNGEVAIVNGDDESQEQENEKRVIAEYDSILTTAGDNALVSDDGIATTTAIASYYADGYEGIITLENKDDLKKELLDTLPDEAVPLDDNIVAKGDPIYKLTDNNYWHLALWVKNGDDVIINYEVDKRVILDMGTTRITAKIEDVKLNGDYWFVLISSDMYYKDLVKYRKKRVNIIFDEFTGAVIENSSIISNEDVPGVYVKQRSGSFKWIPIKRIRTSNDKSIVAEDMFYDEDGNQVKTINYYDEVLRDPKAEGY